MKITVTRDAHQNVLTISGALDEAAATALTEARTHKASRVALDLFAIERVNSKGIKLFEAFCAFFVAHGELRLMRCSPVMVDCLNMIPSVLRSAALTSFCVPYDCKACRRGFDVELETALVPRGGVFAPMPCQRCGAPAAAAALPDDYCGDLLDFLSQ